MAAKRKKYKRITFSLSRKQYEDFLKFCRQKRITPRKFLKKIVQNNINSHEARKEEVPVKSPRQLSLFE